ncbi:class I SAM-dependent RNA methyltransferase [Jannaschia sp. 2305UL9-9]|uniref:class I SAM-dependent RNA methyltransferase n=1 Tax=Jannaschia sp. 2305UL9-9 TaxID=3121638 RepID=UPI003528C6FA
MTEEATSHVIERLGIHGDGVAPGPLFVPRTLPGEVVTGAVQGDRLPEPKIVTPSVDRVAAPCPHYRRCGSCAVQHASGSFVADWKVGIVRETLTRAGLDVAIAGIETSPPHSRRRAALSGHKTKKGAVVGFHLRGSSDVVGVPDCKVLHPDLVAVLPALEEVTRLAATRGSDVTLHVTQGPAGIDLAIEGARDFDRQAMVAIAPFGATFARITWNGEAALQQTPPWQAMGRARVVPPPAAFLQATAQGEAALVDHVHTTLAGTHRVVDLFAGCGTFTFPVAEDVPVHAVEGERPLIAALQDGARTAMGLKAVTAEVRDLFRNPLLVQDLARFDAAVIDPPRAGAQAQVAELARSALSRIAFVSCNPVTFARDAALLTGAGWRMGPVTVVDQFRWSPHIELVTSFERS